MDEQHGGVVDWDIEELGISEQADFRVRVRVREILFCCCFGQVGDDELQTRHIIVNWMKGLRKSKIIYLM